MDPIKPEDEQDSTNLTADVSAGNVITPSSANSLDGPTEEAVSPENNPSVLAEPLTAETAVPQDAEPASVSETASASVPGTAQPLDTPQPVAEDSAAPATALNEVAPPADSAAAPVAFDQNGTAPTENLATPSGIVEDTAQPEVPQNSTPPIAPTNPKGKKRWVLPALIVIILLVLFGGGYVFGMYLPNRPSAVYAKSLSNTGKAVDALVSYGEKATQQQYKSYDINAKLTDTSSDGSYGGTLTGSIGTDASAKLNITANVMGLKINADVLSVQPQKGTISTPDIYVRLTGIKQPLDAYGLNSLDTFDGQWLSVDHTLINTFTSSLKSWTQNTSGSSLGVPTRAQVEDAINKVQTVNKQYIFTADSNKGVLQKQSYVGKETMDGRSVYHYKVGYSKANLQAYVAAVGSALDNSSLNAWSKQANDGKSLSQAMDLSEAKKSIDTLRAGYTFDVYADAGTKLIHAIRLTDPSDASSIVTISQNYTGGDEYPFALSFSGKEAGSSSVDSGKLSFSLNQKTNKVSGTFTTKADGDDIALTFGLSPSNSTVAVSAPANAKPIMDVLGQLGLGDTL